MANMPRNWQRTKNNPYLLPHNLYMRVLYIIRDYDRMKDEYQNILHSGSGPNISTGIDLYGEKVSMIAGRGKGGVSNQTYDKAVQLAMMSDELHAIEQALRMIPEEYRKGVMHSIKYGEKYPDSAHYNTWRNWKYKLAYHVAERLHLI